MWLNTPADTNASVQILQANASASGIALGQIYYGPALTINFNDPNVDPRTPDIIVTPNVGVTYSGSKSKLAEHGGFAHDDTNVMLLVSNPSFQASTVHTSVGTAQVAPTILKALGLNPSPFGLREPMCFRLFSFGRFSDGGRSFRGVRFFWYWLNSFGMR